MEGPPLVLNKETIQPARTSIQNSRKPNMQCIYITNHLACRNMRTRTCYLPVNGSYKYVIWLLRTEQLRKTRNIIQPLINKIWTIEVPSIMCHKQTQQSEVSSLNRPWGVGPPLPLNPRTLGKKVETIISHMSCPKMARSVAYGCTCGCIAYLDIWLQQWSRRSTGVCVNSWA